MFLVFGSFTIGAGLLLVLTIVMMLAESRRVDEAIIRSIGLKRSDMRALALMEGMITSSIASLLGGVFGLFLAWIVSAAFSSVFATAGADGIAYSFDFESVLIGMSLGFVIAMSTLWLTALWTSKLNIVQALRVFLPQESEEYRGGCYCQSFSSSERVLYLVFPFLPLNHRLHLDLHCGM